MIKGIYKATQGMAYEALRIDILALHPENARRAREKVLQRLIRYGKISSQEFREALSEPIPTKRHLMPFKAPHLTHLLSLEDKNHVILSEAKLPRAKRDRIYSTIDTEIQGLSERILRAHLAPL